MKTVLIVQARMGSKRLPGKMMLPLAGEPLIYRLLERVKRCTLVDEIVLAIPATDDNIPLIEVAQRAGVSAFAGHEDDVLDRYYQCAKTFEADVIVRVPGDNPCVEPGEVDRIVEAWRPKSFASNIQNILGNGYPDGIGAEVFGFDMLEFAANTAVFPETREHVHRSWFLYGEGCASFDHDIITVQCPPDYQGYEGERFDVNTRADYDFIKSIYADLYPRDPAFTFADIKQWLGPTVSVVEWRNAARARSTH